MDSIVVHSPATVSNVVCGFDCLGFALGEPYDVVRVSRIDAGEISIIHLDDFGLPTDKEQNVAGVALQAMLDELNADHGFEVEITKGIRPGSGIGSSAASACGALTAANLLLEQPFTKLQLAAFALEGEELASGSRHSDNVAPCIFGGITLVRSSDPLDIVSLEHPELYATVIHPQIEIRTADARALLPTEVSLSAAVKNWSNLGALVAALAQGDLELFSRSMKDEIVEPARRSLIPHFEDVMAAAAAAGTLGSGISGSGPSMFALSNEPRIAEAVAKMMEEVYEPTGIDFNVYVTPVSPHGVRVVK